MSQPYDRACRLPAAGTIDEEAGQFWVENPSDLVGDEKNLSAYERNKMYLNLGAGEFADVSFVSGTDSDGDGRCAVAADLDNDGMQDLIVRQAGGGALKVFRNQFKKAHWLRIALRGNKSNGMGVGSKITVWVNEQQFVREIFPANTYMSQQPCEVHFGLGKSSTVDKIEIRWPSGVVQTLKGVSADQRLMIEESD